ncbi:MAG: dihydropteroate synthase [Berryella intestinalis]|uniref:dihydropteroate synthase n=1 Tax=Berryella intestinalis TaxID=1531429 RepID=UPI002A758FFA|nr:dihydropteroate synthase [Berryella intestinalis]MDY3130039.1 dihydropteroate synthase [Berryella intestinalis]
MWRCSTYEFDERMPIIMGILNVTPDSFSDGGQHNRPDDAIDHALKLVEQGAHIIDVGGESTRPGAAEVSVEEELRRTVGVVAELSRRGVCVSIDTRHAEVARACVAAGAAIINDVSGFRDPAMVDAAAACDAGLVVMHMRGEPSTMQNDTSYVDVVAEVRDYLARRVGELEASGIARERICLDPGPGFGKTSQQSLELMRNLQELVRLGYPVMTAASRKRYVGFAYGIDDPKDRDVASAAEALLGCELGATIVRTHNVEATAAALRDLRPLAVIALGCNVALVAQPGEEREAKIAQLNMAIGALCTLPDTDIVDISSFYESEPAYYEDQDSFVNAVALVRTGIAPKELLGYLHAIENSLGRVREIPNGPRTCDLDIVDYQMYVADTEELTLPHPRALERDFVVRPLSEIRPNFAFADGSTLSAADVKYGAAVRIG